MSRFTKIFKGRVDDSGDLRINQERTLEQWLLFLAGNEVEVIVRKPKKVRSQGQNGYYWGVVIDKIAEKMGLLPDETHQFLKEKFLKEDIQVEDSVYHVTRASKDLDIREWEEYMRKCRVWANQEFGLWIPEPGEVERHDTM